ncbi:MAG: tetratricopeptide repeat protein [Candidatus Aminicenantes bacterium]|nr:tetratricopeptide repeat protein [Candidatus Aminicenantes bacterium]
MPIIRNITIEQGEKENHFQVTWHDPATNKKDRFMQSLTSSEEMEVNGNQHSSQVAVGERLFRFLDSDSRHLQFALDKAADWNETLQINLRACKPALDWPFELMAQNGAFLLTDKVHLVRHLSGWGQKQKEKPRERALKLLFVACSPVGIEPELDYDHEEDAIFEATEKLPIDIDVEDSGSLEGLRDMLVQEKYDVVHLSGHMTMDKHGYPYFIMENETGCQDKISPKKLWDKALINNTPRLLFLSGCHPGYASNIGNPCKTASSFARLMVDRHNMPAVLGWDRPVGDEQAIHAEKTLYHALSSGQTILEAVQKARYELVNKFSSSSNVSWPLLRIFSNGIPLDQIVAKGLQLGYRNPRVEYTFLKNSNVRVLARGFVDRRRSLQRSMRTLKLDTTDKVGVLLLGAGGLGKSCLAGKICRRLKTHTLIIVHGKLKEDTLKDALKDAFVQARDEEGKKILKQKIAMTEKLEELCASSFEEKNYLILLDDFELNMEETQEGRPGPLMCEAADLLRTLLHYLPISGNMTQMIITSRFDFSLTRQNLDQVAGKLDKIFLACFQEFEQRKKGRELKNIWNFPEQSLVPELLAAGHGNPLLMEWLDTLVGQLNTVDVVELRSAISGKQEDFIREHAIGKLLNHCGEALERLLRRLSVFRLFVLAEGVRLMAESAGLEGWENSLKQGLGLSLIERDRTRKGYRLVPLLREKLSKEFKSEEIHSCHEAALCYYKKICEDLEHFDPELLEELIFHALQCEEEETASREGARLVRYLRKHLAFEESRRVGSWILHEKSKESSTVSDALLLKETAITMKELGEYEKAIEYHEKSLVIDRIFYGELHIAAAEDLNNLGLVWSAKGDYNKAQKYYEEALYIVKYINDEKAQILIGNLLNNLGKVLTASGEVEDGIVYYEHALRFWEDSVIDKHANIAITLNNLGSAYNECGEYDKAIEFFKKALDIYQSFLKALHHKKARILNNLGESWRGKKNYRRARKYFRQALETWTKYYGEKNPFVVAVLNNLGSVWVSLGKPEVALDFLKKSHSIDNELKLLRHAVDAKA